MSSYRRANVSKSACNIDPAHVGAIKHVNLLGETYGTSNTELMPITALAISRTLYSRSAIVVAGVVEVDDDVPSPGMNLAL